MNKDILYTKKSGFQLYEDSRIPNANNPLAADILHIALFIPDRHMLVRWLNKTQSSKEVTSTPARIQWEPLVQPIVLFTLPFLASHLDSSDRQHSLQTHGLTLASGC